MDRVCNPLEVKADIPFYTTMSAYDPKRTLCYSISGKWLELLKQIAPGVTRGGGPSGSAQTAGIRPVRRNPVRGAVARGGGEPGQRARRAARSSAPSRPSRAPEWRPDRDGGARCRGVHRDLIVTLAARHKLPAVYYERYLRRRRRPDLLWA